MPEEKYLNETVISCPRCEGKGERMKTMLDPGWPGLRTFIDRNDWMRCEMCEGSGRVFVVPARVIGPAQKAD